MKLFSNLKVIKENYFSLLLSLIPISLIAGNMVINITIILIILSGLIFFFNSIFKIKYFFLDKLIFLFFILTLCIGIYNDIFLFINHNDFSLDRGIYSTTIKSFLFLRFLFLYLIIRILIQKDLLNFKIFFFVCSLCGLFVCLDIFVQLLTGTDFFGHEVDDRFRKLGGPFGDEYIAGGYIQRFSLFAFFIIPAFYSEKSKKIYYFWVFILFLIFFAGITFSGNRMPLILFFLTLLLFFIFEIKDKKKILSFILVGVVTFFLIFNFNIKVKKNFDNFFIMGKNLIISSVDKNMDYSYLPYYNEFNSGYNTWLVNKTFGGGIKNFNFYCYKSNKKFETNYTCNTHPHNYYLEILTETGLIGFLSILSILIIILYLSFIKKYFLRSSLKDNVIITPFIFLFFSEIFPLKSTGSFFTTGNASYIFLIIAVLVGLIQKENSFENKYH